MGESKMPNKNYKKIKCNHNWTSIKEFPEYVFCYDCGIRKEFSGVLGYLRYLKNIMRNR